MALARRASVDLQYNGKNISSSLADYLESFSYTDSADGKSDCISIVVNNQSGKWTGAWMPSKGDMLLPTIRTEHWNGNGDSSISCGVHILDSFSARGGMSGAVCSLDGVSMPADEAFKATKRTKTWEKVNLSQIAMEVAGRAGVSCMFEAGDIFIESREQNEQADCEFLNGLCDTYGYIMKAYNNKIVVFDPARYESKAAIRTFTPKDVDSWSYSTIIDGTYTGAKVSYTNQVSGGTADVTVGSSTRLLSINAKADSISDAQLIAKGKLAAENRKAETAELSCMLDLRVASGCCIILSGFGKVDGKYMVLSVTHSLGSGSRTSISAYKIPGSVGSAAAANTPGSYTVQRGDSLWSIAKALWGNGADYMAIYEANAEMIEAAAGKMGKTSSENGYWIAEGTQLVIPKR